MATLRDSVTAEVKRQAKRMPFHTSAVTVCSCSSLVDRSRDSRTNNPKQMPTDDKFNYHPDVLAEDDETDRLTARGTRPRLTLRANADFTKVFQFLEVDCTSGPIVGQYTAIRPAIRVSTGNLGAI